MAIFKKLLFVSLLTGAYPALLHCMDGNQETDEAIVKRLQESGYLSSMLTNFDMRTSNYTNDEMKKDITNESWGYVASDIVAGCNLDCLFNNPTVTQDHIKEICSELKKILDDEQYNTNNTDHIRITNFLRGCLNSKKLTYDNLTEWLPADTKNINQIMPHLKAPKPAHKNLLANINLYKIIIPVAAVIALAAIAYKWWSKQTKDTPTDDEIDDQTATNGKDEIAHTL